MTHSITSRMKHMAGLSLVELMIAMTLGLATIAGVGWVYLGTSQTYRTQDSFARLQEGARFAFEVIGNDLRMAGATGCSYRDSVNVVNGYTLPARWYANLLEQPLVSVEKTGSAGVSEFSDALRILRANVSNEYVVQSHDATGTFTLTAAHDIAAGSLLVATDCINVAVFQAISAGSPNIVHAGGSTPGNSTPNLGVGGPHTFAQGSRIYRLSSSTYYVATNPAGEPALFRMRPVGAGAAPTAEELIEGVEDIQVSFAVDTTASLDGVADFVDPDGDGDPYLTADQVTNLAIAGTTADKWRRVVSVRISLLMRTVENNVVPEAQTYSYNGASVLATDRRLRKVFTHVVKMRNR